MEGCVCDEGYLRSGNECVPADQCGCISDGQYYQYGQAFYPDALCQKECTCNGTVRMRKTEGLHEVICVNFVHTQFIPQLTLCGVQVIQKELTLF